MFEPVLRGEVHVILAGELWAVVCVANSWNAKPGKVSLNFVSDCSCQSVVKCIHLNPVRKVTYCYEVGCLSMLRMSWMIICHASVGIGIDELAR